MSARPYPTTVNISILKTTDFYYNLPTERIAQTPLEPRHASKLLIYDRMTNQIEHRIFWDIVDYLMPGDLLVINQTRVIPARIFARKETGGKVEILLLRQVEPLIWEALVGGKRVLPGKKLYIDEVGVEIDVLSALEGSRRLIRFSDLIEKSFSKIGQMPLPPYIHEPLKDPDRYQTVYAQKTGSAAAPTAGLHFTQELMDRIREMGADFCEVTLHVGLDTFAPVTEENPLDHQIHTEWCEVTERAAQKINHAHQNGGRIIAVGTTSVRTLESAAQNATNVNVVGEISGPTNLFILPGYTFKAVDMMITNFHLPNSTLLMLVSAFAGRERVLNLYQTAIDLNYRFYSFGDAMLIK